MMYASVSFIASVPFACVSHSHHDVREMATEQQPRSTRVSSWSICVCHSSSIHVCSHGACRCMGVSFIERKASDKRATAAAKATEPQPRGCQELGEGQARPGIGGRTTSTSTSTRTRTSASTRTRTRTRTHAHARSHSIRPRSLHRLPSLSLPFVLVTAIRPCHRLSLISRPCHCHSCWSPPVVDQSSLSPPAIRPCHCLLAAIRPFRRVSPPFVSPGQPHPRSGSRILVAWAAQRGDAYR